MNFELHKHNIDKVQKVLEGVQGKNIMINDIWLKGVVSIEITESEVYDGDPEEDFDGGKTDYIDLTFNFENGKASHNFCPDNEHCEITFETDELWIIKIEDLKKYIERQKSDLDWKLKEYQEYMSR